MSLTTIHMRADEETLWQAQLKQWPQSVILTVQDMLAWAASAPTELEQGRRFRRLAFCLQYDVRVFYRTSPVGKPGWYGCRVGVEPSQYLSNFDDGTPVLGGLT